MARSHDDARALASFASYLRMRTDHPEPTGGYNAAEPLFRSYADTAGFAFERLELCHGHPMYILTWPGAEAALPSIVLLSHMDVVPVDADKWTRTPWGGETVDGKVYGRGAQDMKSVSIQYVEACARLKARGHVPRRTVHILLVPDEEVGGSRGIKLLLGHERITRMNVGFVLDEGLASPGPRFSIFHGERKVCVRDASAVLSRPAAITSPLFLAQIWWVKLRATGPAGHGSRFVPHTAVAQLAAVITRIGSYHVEQRAELERTCGCGKQLGDFTTANVTMLSAGCSNPATPQYNVIPTVAEAGVDIRIPATVPLDDFRKRLDAWCAVEGGGVTWEPLPQVCGEGDAMLRNPTTPVDGPDARWFRTFSDALGPELLNAPSIFPAATDSRWVRLMLDAPCLGFSPIRNTPILLHDHDEFVFEDGFLEGINVYERVILGLADAPPE